MSEAEPTNGRDQRIRDEVAALWRELYGEPPPIRAGGAAMLDAIMRSLPEVSYDRLRSPHLRPSSLTGPQTNSAGAARFA